MKTILIHIPKNAGSSICEYFISAYGDGSCYGIDEDGGSAHFLAYADQIIDRYDFISGHVPLGLIDHYVHKFDLIICSVRNPFTRFLSMANYICENYDEYGGISSLACFADAFYFSNVATRNEQCGYIGQVNTFWSALDSIRKYGIVVMRHEDINKDFIGLCVSKGLSAVELKVENYSKVKRFSVLDLAADHELIADLSRWFSDDIILHDYISGDLRI
jgi:hypothetical protein